MAGLLLAIIYVSFISLGLPDALLGAAWPIMYRQFEVPVSWMGLISLIISAGTVVSSLMADRLNRKFGTGRVTAVSVSMTAIAMAGFALSGSYWGLVFWAVPYGLGAGGVDSALNNYVAVHYASRHMSWLHCMWGLGAMTGPYIMCYALTGGLTWNMGYWYIGAAQIVLSVILFISLPIWKKTYSDKEEVKGESLSLAQVIRIPGAKAVMLTFFCYCALEQTVGQWASSYLVMHTGMAEETAAALASLFYAGITAGRFASGFMTIRFSDKQMTRIGFVFVGIGIAIMLLPFGKISAIIGLLLIGFGGAPIYPCVIHSTPEYFGADRSQAIIGVLMASAYVGTCVMPPVFGLIADLLGTSVLPVVLAIILAVMAVSYETLYAKK